MRFSKYEYQAMRVLDSPSASSEVTVANDSYPFVWRRIVTPSRPSNWFACSATVAACRASRAVWVSRHLKVGCSSKADN